MLNASAKIWSARGASHHPALVRNCLTQSHMSERYLPNYQSVLGGVGADAVAARDRPLGKDVELKYGIFQVHFKRSLHTNH